jgi:hypothetical protein
MELAAGHGVGDCVLLTPERIPFLDALRTMQGADLLLLLGSADSHYTASKIFPYWLADRPIFGVFHTESTVATLAGELGGVCLRTYGDGGPESIQQEVEKALGELCGGNHTSIPDRKVEAFSQYSPEGVAGQFASLFDLVTAGRVVSQSS